MVSISSVNDVLVVAAMIRDLCIFLNRILFACLIGPLWIVMPLSARIVDGFPGEMAKNTFAFWKNPVMIVYYGTTDASRMTRVPCNVPPIRSGRRF